MTRTTDDALLDSLGAALATAPIAPSPEELAALRTLVTRHDVVVPLPAPRPARHPLRHVAAVAAVVLGLILAVGALALATGSPLPDGLRAPVRALGLPVDSAAVAETRAAMGDLRDALGQADDAVVTRARTALVARLARLDRDQRAAIDAEARALLARADARLRPAEIGDPAQQQRPQAGPSASEGPSVTPAPSPGASGSDPTVGGGPNAEVPSAGEPADDPPGSTVTTEPDEHEIELEHD